MNLHRLLLLMTEIKKEYTMKKINNGFIVMLLAVSILVGIVPVCVNAGESVAATQEVVPEIGNNTNVIPESYESNTNLHNFTLTNGQKGYIETVLKNAIKGNTWAFSTTFTLSEIMNNYGPGITIARGDGKYDTPSFFQLALRNISSGKVQYVLYENEAYDTNRLDSNIRTYKTVGDALKTDVDYRLTMQIRDGELLQCWLNEQLIAEIALKGYGFTNLTPCFGWSSAGSAGTFTDCKMWEESESVIPTIGNNTNVIPQSNDTYDNMHDFRLENSNHTPGYIHLADAIKGDTWAFSTTINLEYIKVNYGPCITIARGKKSYDDPSYLRLSLKQYNNTSQCVLFEDKTSTTGYTKGITVKTIYDLEKLQTGVNYQVTMQIHDRELLQCWVNGQLIAEMNLKELGFTDITPCFGWRCAGSTATFTGCKMWEDMQDLPIVSQSYDKIDGYRTDGNIAPIRSGYVFAGWFTDKECTKSITEDKNSGQAYAKFVPEKVLRVKYQVKQNGSTANLRFVTTVDSRKYQNVGFVITFGDVTKTPTSTIVYKQIISRESGEAYYNDPSVFSSASEWFHTFSITSIPTTAYQTDIIVAACWTTQDGTIVTGEVRNLKVRDGLQISSDKDAIKEVFHDPANEYMIPLEPKKTDDITLRVRTELNNVSNAVIAYTNDKGATWKTVPMTLERVDDTGYYEFFVGTIPAQEELFYYRFICSNDLYTAYVDRNLKSSETAGIYSDCWSVNPGYSTPDWSKGALWYSLVPDSFYNGDTSNDVTTSDYNTVNSWNNKRLGLTDKYGGDLQGVRKKIEHLKELNVDAIYMNPIFKSYQNIGYGQVDFMQIDSSYGNAEVLSELSDELDQNGMKVKMDAVLTFTPWNSYYLDRNKQYPLDGALESQNSAFKDMFLETESEWGGRVVNLSSAISKKLFYTEENSFLRYYSSRYGIDAWRFDCGGTMQGVTSDGTKVSSNQIMADIRSYLKDDNTELLLVSEYSEDSDLMGDSWDSRWNDHYADIMQAYAKGEANEGDISSLLKSTIHKFPRSVALSMYNLVTSHDKSRLNLSDSYMEKAMILIQMNYLGSPSIYYGEEIGLNTTSSTAAMNWDESSWDYEKYDFYRALGELRSKFSAVKTGACREMVVNTNQNLYAFGRWDEQGTVVTVASQNTSTVTVDLDVRKIGVPNGTVFTDWMTGKQYTTDEQGILQVKVASGGSVFVTGTQASSYRNKFTIEKLGNASGNVVMESESSYTLEGTGTLGTSDNLTLVWSNIYGAATIEGVPSGDGKALLTMRASEEPNAASYNVIVSKKGFQVMMRKQTGGQMENVCSKDNITLKSIKIERTADNNFCIFYKTDVFLGYGTSDWKEFSDSEISISVGRSMIAGFAPYSGKLTMESISLLSDSNEVLYDKFESGIGLLDGSYTVEDGQLVLDGNANMATAVTGGKNDDWTFQAKLESSVSAGTYAGVLCMDGTGQFVVAGRTELNGKKVLFFGRTTDGSVVIDHFVADTDSDKPVIIQLQRIGTTYSAVYSYEGTTWQQIGDSLFANYSNELVGVFAEGMKANFDYVSFGESIHDGKSFNTPHAEGLQDAEYTSTVAAKMTEGMKILQGTWEYGEEGYQASADARLAVTDKVYEDVRVNVTLKPEQGNGYAAVGFGKQSYDSADTEGYLLKYTSSGQLSLIQDGTVLQTVTQTPNEDGELRIVLEVRDGDICVYAGQDATCVIRVEDTEYSDGHIVFVTSGIAAGFLNYRFSSLDARWNVLDGTVSGGANSLTCTSNGSGYGRVTSMGIGVTDFVTTATIRLGSTQDANGPLAEGGILFSASEGASPDKTGISVSLLSGGVLRLRVNGETKQEHQFDSNVTKVQVLIVRKDCQVDVYVLGIEQAVLSYTDTMQRGGGIQYYSINATTIFANLGLEDIAGRELSDANLYKDWKVNILPKIARKYESGDYLTEAAWKHLTRYATDHGTWLIQNGMLSCVSAEKYIAGVSVYDSIYDNFELEFEFKYDKEPQGVWGYVSLRKASVVDSHLSSCYSLVLSYKGQMSLLYNGGNVTGASGTSSNFKQGEWNKIRIRYIGDQIEVICLTGGKEETMFKYVDSNASSRNMEGFISFASNQSLYSVKNIKITPINE